MSLPIHAMKTGDERLGRPRTLSLARVLALSGGPIDRPGWPDRNLHTDATAAADAGLAEIVVSGTQWEGLVAALLVETFGRAWFDGGRLSVKIPRSVRVGDTLTAGLRLDALSVEGTRETAQLTVWCNDSAGQPVLVGTASCTVPPRGAAA